MLRVELGLWEGTVNRHHYLIGLDHLFYGEVFSLKNPITTKDVAEIMGVTARYVTMQRSRQGKRVKDDLAAGLVGEAKPGDIPEPDMVLDGKPLWDRSTIEKWQASRPDPGRRNSQNR